MKHSISKVCNLLISDGLRGHLAGQQPRRGFREAKNLRQCKTTVTFMTAVVQYLLFSLLLTQLKTLFLSPTTHFIRIQRFVLVALQSEILFSWGRHGSFKLQLRREPVRTITLQQHISLCSVFKFQLIYQSTKVYALVEQARVDYCILCTEYLRRMFGSKAPMAVRVWLVACSCCEVVDSLQV